MGTATNKQTWAIFGKTGLDVREAPLTKEYASGIIGRLFDGEDIGKIREELLRFDEVVERREVGFFDKAKTKNTRDDNWMGLLRRAEAAGMEAGRGNEPTPMVVSQHESSFDDNSSVVDSWYVSEGMCGFAWVSIPDGRSAFAAFLRRHKGEAIGDEGVIDGKRQYGGGTCVTWVRAHGQSYERKQAHAAAFAVVLRATGIPVNSGSRLD